MKFHDFQKTNQQRSKEWMQDQGSDIERLLFHSNELGDECGEVQGAVKKYVRMKWGIPGGLDEDEAWNAVCDEIADVITVAFLLADWFGIDVARAVASKFNRVSDKHGFDIKISPIANHSELIERLRIVQSVLVRHFHHTASAIVGEAIDALSGDDNV